MQMILAFQLVLRAAMPLRVAFPTFVLQEGHIWASMGM